MSRMDFRPLAVFLTGLLHFFVCTPQTQYRQGLRPDPHAFCCVRHVCAISGGGFGMKRDEQLGNSTPVPADRRHDEHRMIADAWLASALDGIRQMSHDEAARREVARKIF
ncbi:hypothetical protein [Paraburkholderia kururiensis]|uniref:hypothetical protein n=2 Tax=Paraburkholderia kururiensis TaxID=984307 RepID=UPI00110C72A2|nr:hypothetical protein [Paraburkholderia kururiensis]